MSSFPFDPCPFPDGSPFLRDTQIVEVCRRELAAGTMSYQQAFEMLAATMERHDATDLTSEAHSWLQSHGGGHLIEHIARVDLMVHEHSAAFMVSGNNWDVQIDGNDEDRELLTMMMGELIQIHGPGANPQARAVLAEFLRELDEFGEEEP